MVKLLTWQKHKRRNKDAGEREREEIAWEAMPPCWLMLALTELGILT